MFRGGGRAEFSLLGFRDANVIEWRGVTSTPRINAGMCIRPLSAFYGPDYIGIHAVCEGGAEVGECAKMPTYIYHMHFHDLGAFTGFKSSRGFPGLLSAGTSISSSGSIMLCPHNSMWKGRKGEQFSYLYRRLVSISLR